MTHERWLSAVSAICYMKAIGMRAALIPLLCAAVSPGIAAVLSLPNLHGSPGDTLVESVTFVPGDEAVSSLQFDLEWDSGFDVSPAPGAAVGLSSKALSVVIRGAHSIRCLAAGLNTNKISGEIARVFVILPAAIPPGTLQIRITNVVAASPISTSIPVTAQSATVTVGAGAPTQPVGPQSVLNGASLLSGVVSSGEIITIIGSVDTNSPSVLVNGNAAPVLDAAGHQINAIVPYGLDVSAPATIAVKTDSGATPQFSVATQEAAPAIFTLSASGAGQGAILNENYSVNTPSNPADAGSYIMVYATGFGALVSQPADGQIMSDGDLTAAAVSATIDGITADVIYAGAAPGLVAGANQINIRVPDGLQPNLSAPLVLFIGSMQTQPGVTVSIRAHN